MRKSRWTLKEVEGTEGDQCKERRIWNAVGTVKRVRDVYRSKEEEEKERSMKQNKV